MSGLEVDKMLVSLKQMFEAEYARGARDAAQKIMRVAQTSDLQAAPGSKTTNGTHALKSGPKRRAPRGAPRTLVERVLTTEPASVVEIAAAAQGEIEKRVSQSAIRLELNRGKSARRYRVRKGKWSLNKN